ncbi:MAG TPA: DMT family transporter [Cytophagaceae bacterium]|nr:DMT family transporter [Cytophagaceae bacterium]
MIKFSSGAKMMFLSIVSFSLMHLCIKAIPNIPVHQIISFRSVFSILICLYILRKDKIPMWGNHKPLLILRGLIGALSLFCFFYSIQHLPLATAVTISNLIPLFALLLAALFLKEKITGLQWFFFVLSFSGVLLIKGFDDRIGMQDLLIALAAAFFTACAHFLVRRLRDFDHSFVIIFYFPLVTIPLVVPYTLLHWISPDLFEWGMLLLVGLFTHIGQVYLTKAYAKEEVSGVTNIYYIGIILSLAYGYLFFNETYTLLSFAGMALIVAGIFLNMYYKKL